VLRDALLLELRGINRTAAAIAVVQGDPGIMDKFRMPYGVNDTTLMAQAKSMGDVAGQMTTDFVAYGHAATFVADLQTHLGNFNSADVTQNVGQQAVGGTTAETLRHVIEQEPVSPQLLFRLADAGTRRER
jgi:hypothetical protein